MICPRCLEVDPQCFNDGSCRRCLVSRYAHEVKTYFQEHVENAPVELTRFQKEISDVLVIMAKNESVFVDAVCGAGKTEICLALVEEVLKEGKKIAWVIPRREVVLEIQARLSKYYPDQKVIAVCEGFLEELDGDIIVATSHQMFRYYQVFDLIILDEPDAFPFRNNSVLYNYLKAACKGTVVYLSATFDIDHVNHLYLSLRPSLVLLPVPKIVCSPFMLLYLLYDLKKYDGEQCLIFVPTKRIARWMAFILQCPYITSSSLNKQTVIDDFRNKRGKLVTTTVLERGVTFIDCFVFVYHACHRVFDEGSLVQIAGRAMRGMNPQKGGVTFYCTEYTEAIKKSCQRINKANDDAYVALNQ